MQFLKYTYLLLLLVFTQCISIPEAMGQSKDKKFDKMASRMAKGDVNDISVEELKNNKESVILLDAREKNEYDISHIPGAIWIGYDDFDLERVKELDKGAKVVVYCSVGYRSERIGEKLQEAEFTDISNLLGSIFKWVNDGNEVVNKEETPTPEVHGFNKAWGKWVKEGKVVY